jgi:succinate dehydrogenase hydrophobic anchor subunit
VLLHAAAGSYAVLIDFGGVARLKSALAASAILLAIVGFVYGTITILAFQPPM